MNIKIAIGIVAIAATVSLAGCKDDGGGVNEGPTAYATTHVTPSPSKSSSRDSTAKYPNSQAEVNKFVKDGATFTCQDGYMSFKTKGACVGHGGISEVVRH